MIPPIPRVPTLADDARQAIKDKIKERSWAEIEPGVRAAAEEFATDFPGLATQTQAEIVEAIVGASKLTYVAGLDRGIEVGIAAREIARRL